MNNFEWLQQWFAAQINGDREHSYGIRIETLDNPGWNIEIDLGETEFEQINLPFQLFEKSENDWFCREIKNSVFKASGDISKLDFLLGLFREFVQN